MFGSKIRHWNPERRAFRGLSYRKGCRRIGDLRTETFRRADRREDRRPE
jgi:hypothetical protein